MENILDLIIIGGGPVGLYANQYACKKGLKTRLIDKSSELGGKLKSVYPDNIVYDVGGIKSWKAGKLIDNMVSQSEKFNPDYCLGQTVTKILQKNLTFSVKTNKSEHLAYAVLIATGRGIYISKSLVKLVGKAKEKAGLTTGLKNKNLFIGKKVVVIGGGPETVGWALEAAHSASRVIIINWRYMESFFSLECSRGVPANIDIMEPYGLLEVIGTEKVTGIKVFHVDTGEEKVVDTDVIIMTRGYLSNLSDTKKLGVSLERNGIKVSPVMNTSTAGIFAAGDAVYYSGKKRLISTGTAEAATAIDGIVGYLGTIDHGQ